MLFAPSRFGLITPKKSLFEKNVEIIKKQGLKSSTVVGYVTSKPKSNSDYEHLQLDDAALLFEGRVYSPIPKTAVMEQVAKAPLHCEATLQTLMEQADGDYSIPNAQRRLDCSWKRPNRSSTALFWRKQRHRCLCHKPKSPLETRNRKLPCLFHREIWRLSTKKASSSNLSKH